MERGIEGARARERESSVCLSCGERRERNEGADVKYSDPELTGNPTLRSHCRARESDGAL